MWERNVGKKKEEQKKKERKRGAGRTNSQALRSLMRRVRRGHWEVMALLADQEAKENWRLLLEASRMGSALPLSNP